MPLSLKVFTSTLLIGGGVGGIPLLLSSQNGIGGEAEKGVSAPINAGHEVTDTETEESRPETIEQANVGNCVIKKELEELENIIWTFEDSINIDTFVKVFPAKIQIQFLVLLWQIIEKAYFLMFFLKI